MGLPAAAAQVAVGAATISPVATGQPGHSGDLTSGQASKQSCTFWDLTLKRDAGGAGPTQNINFESDLRKGLLAIGQPSACKLR